MTMSTRSLRPLATFSTAVTSVSKSTSTIATCAPLARSFSTVASPMPLAAPVTSATHLASGAGATGLIFACSRLQYSTSKRSPRVQGVYVPTSAAAVITSIVCS